MEKKAGVVAEAVQYLKGFILLARSSMVRHSSTDEETNESPNNKLRLPGGWKTMPYIIGNESFERVSSFGLTANLTVYLVKKYHMPQVAAANFINIWTGTTNFAPLLGAFLADAYFGKYKVLAFACIVSVLGMVVMTLTAGIHRLQPPSCSPEAIQLGQCSSASGGQMGVLILALGLLTIGAGGVRPCNLPFGMDQFDRTTEYGRKGTNSFFNWYYTTNTAAVMLAVTFIVYLQDSVSWVLGFAAPALLMLLATVLFFIGTNRYIHVPPEGSIFSGVAKVFVAAFKKRSLRLPADQESTLYNPPFESRSNLVVKLQEARTAVKGGYVSLQWLQQNFQVVEQDATDEQVMQHTRAYILFQLGSGIVGDKSGNKVHLRYLLLLENIFECGNYSWGAASLAVLYQYLDQACLKKGKQLAGFLTLLQIWCWEHFHVGRPSRIPGVQLPLCPLGSRWRTPRSWANNVKTAQIEFYRNEFDVQDESQVCWNPYEEVDLMVLPVDCRQGHEVWMSRTWIVCFGVAAMHVPDRVMRQFGLRQHIPEIMEMCKMKKAQGKPRVNWLQEQQLYIQAWSRRRDFVQFEAPSLSEDFAACRRIYMEWYWQITIRWLTRRVDDAELPNYRPTAARDRYLLHGLHSLHEDIHHLEGMHASHRPTQSVTAKLKKKIKEMMACFKSVDPSLKLSEDEDVCHQPHRTNSEENLPEIGVSLDEEDNFIFTGVSANDGGILTQESRGTTFFQGEGSSFHVGEGSGFQGVEVERGGVVEDDAGVITQVYRRRPSKTPRRGGRNKIPTKVFSPP